MAGIRPQKYFLTFPFDAKQVARADEMFDDLYQQLRRNVTTGNVGDTFIADSLGKISGLAIGTNGAFLRAGTIYPEWSALLLPNAAVKGDLLYASATNVISGLADIAVGNVLISGGVGVAPSWGKVDLTAHISGVLPLANGGTATSTVFTLGSVVFAGASGVYTQNNSGLFFDTSNIRLGIGMASPSYGLDIRKGSTLSQVHINSASTDRGGYFSAFPSFDAFNISGDMAFDASAWRAKTTQASMISFDAGSIGFFTNNGLVAGNTFSPTARAYIYPSGGVAFLGTIADPGAGIFKIDGSLQITTALAVGQGGTGRATHTAYAVLCGGTSSSAAQQSIASVGTSGHVLTSNGAGALPTFQASSGGNHDLLDGTVDQDTLAGSVVRGDIIYGNSTPKWARLAKPGTSSVLVNDATDVAWSRLPSLDGIVFPATQVASAGANTLDDYEEGSWTPTITATGGASGQTYAVQVGRYVKVGKMVTAQFQVQFSNAGTLTGSVQIGGFPFTSENTSDMYSTLMINQFANLATAVVWLFGYIGPNVSAGNLNIMTAAATAGSAMVQGNVANNTQFVGSVTYYAG